LSVVSRLIEKIRELLLGESRKEFLAIKMRHAKDFISALPKGNILQFSCLCLILLTAVLIRLMPLRWGFFLSEFDPYFQYRMTDYVVKNGFQAWFSWHDDMSWYPVGRDVFKSAYISLPFTAALLYMFLSGIGANVTVFQVCVVFPVIMAAATCIVIYFFGKDLWSRSVGLLSALFMALNTSHISRTSLGFFDDETIGIFTMILLFMFYLRAISPDRSLRSCLFYSIFSGLALSYLSLGWGAFRYTMALIAMYSLVLVILRRYSHRLLVAYTTTIGLQLLVASQHPYLSWLPKEWSTMAVVGVFLILCTSELLTYVKTLRAKLGSSFCFLAAILVGLVILWNQGFILNPTAMMKFWSVVNPSGRIAMPLVESVAEHRPATWASLFYEIGILAFLATFGFFFVIRRFRQNDIFLALLGLSSLYFAGSMVRLTLILGPAVAILAAITVVELGKPSIDILREAVIFPKRKIRVATRIGREFGAVILLILIIAIMPTFNKTVSGAYSPATIATSSMPVVPRGGEEQRYQDWLETLVWMRENLPARAVVASWWDYGYWITAIAERRSLADNGTINATQIGLIARMFLSNETGAIAVLKKFDVTHVAIFVTWASTKEGQVSFYGFGEDSKWYWMARIGNGTRFQDEQVKFFEKRAGEEVEYTRKILVGDKVVSEESIADKKGLKDTTVLGMLMWQGMATSGVKTSEYFRLVFTSSNYFVFVYEVQYPESTAISCLLSNTTIARNQTVTISGRITGAITDRIGSATAHLLYSLDYGTSWYPLADVRTTPEGKYEYRWTPEAATYLIQAKWDGIRGKFMGATSPYQTLKVIAPGT